MEINLILGLQYNYAFSGIEQLEQSLKMNFVLGDVRKLTCVTDKRHFSIASKSRFYNSIAIGGLIV